MIEPPEPSHSHASHTGRRWLDVALALSAMFVSVVSLILAVEHGRTMERMAEANTRMVEASSWPFVQFETHNVDAEGKPSVRLVLGNAGIGPARLETLEMWWNGQPMASPSDLIKACCVSTPEERAQADVTIWSLGLAIPAILRPGDQRDVLSAAGSSKNTAFWNKFNVERDHITVRVCYCSVFDECWLGSGTTTHPDRVASCPVPEQPFGPSPPR